MTENTAIIKIIDRNYGLPDYHPRAAAYAA